MHNPGLISFNKIIEIKNPDAFLHQDLSFADFVRRSPNVV